MIATTQTKFFIRLALAALVLVSFSSVPYQIREGRALQQVAVKSQTVDISTVGSQCNSLPKTKAMLNPFKDLTYGAATSTVFSDPVYSSFHCIGAAGAGDMQTEVASLKARRPNYINRACYYRNLYYRIKDQTFHFLASPAEARLWEAKAQQTRDLEEYQGRMNVSIGAVFDTATQIDDFKPWRPHLQTKLDTGNYSTVSAKSGLPTYFLLFHPFHSFNFGHMLWDDMLSLFSLMDLFGLDQEASLSHTLPLFVENFNKKNGQNFGGSDGQWRCAPWNTAKWRKCLPMHRRGFPQFLKIETDPCSGDMLRTGNWFRGMKEVGRYPGNEANSTCQEQYYLGTDGTSAAIPPLDALNVPPPDTDYILLDHVMAGIGRLAYFGCQYDCSIGRAPQWYRFRRFLLQNVWGPSEGCAIADAIPRGYITFSLSGRSSRTNEVWHFTEEIERARHIYGEEAVRVVDMSTHSVREQTEIAANSAVYLTNHGGVGATSIFLPKGSSVIVYWHGKDRKDSHWYESAGYIHTNWISVKDRVHVNATMALIDSEVERVMLTYPTIVAASKRNPLPSAGTSDVV